MTVKVGIFVHAMRLEVCLGVVSLSWVVSQFKSTAGLGGAIRA